VSATESQKLIDRYETNRAAPTDAQNAAGMAQLQAESMRGAPSGAVKFEQQATLTNQQIDALPPAQRDRFRGMLAAAASFHDAATAEADRTKIAQAAQANIVDPVAKDYQQAMNDPVARVQHAFIEPFGARYLGAAGRQQSELLADLGQKFNEAPTADERARLFGRATETRHTLQMQIGSAVGQERARLGEQWKQADQELDRALQNAKSLQIATLGGLDNTSSFQRLQHFFNEGLNSERNAQEFQYRLQQHPADFRPVHEWAEEARTKSAWAAQRIQDDPFRRTPNLPDAPSDPTGTAADDLRAGHFGADLLYRYRNEQARIGKAAEMYHAASQGGPIRDEYLAAHTPPLPLWQQQASDAFFRLAVGLVPGVNLLTDYIVPATSLPPEARTGIDFMSGVIGGMLGEAKLPRFGRANDESGAGGKSPGTKAPEKAGSETGRGPQNGAGGSGQGAASERAQDIEPGGAKGGSGPGGADLRSTGGAPNDAPGIPLLAGEYAREPSGKLMPHPDYRGIYRDASGQSFIRQGGKTYPVDLNGITNNWQVKAREGWPHAPTLRLDAQGNWEVNLDRGLTGGAPRSYYDQLGKNAYELYEAGKTNATVASELGIGKETSMRYIRRYARENSLPGPIPHDSPTGYRWTSRGKWIYQDLANGDSLNQVATKFTEGNAFEAYRSAMRWADEQNLPVAPVTISRTWGIPAEPAGGAARPAWPPRVDPITQEQHAHITEGQLQNKWPQQISQETGVPEAWVRRIETGPGYWSPSKQGYVELGDGDGPTEPALKRQRTNSGSGGGQAQPQAGTSSGARSWGGKELGQYASGDLNKISDPNYDSIQQWLGNEGPPPARLQAELTHGEYTGVTPDMVRAYLMEPNPALTTTQMAKIHEFLGMK
jgi:hypothetical protein